MTSNSRSRAFSEDSFLSKGSSSESKRKSGNNGRKWTQMEDSLLLENVSRVLQRSSEIDFDQIAEKIQTRTAKQARERWYNCLNPNLRKGKWSRSETAKLLDQIIIKGQNWTAIQNVLGNRSMHCIKSKGRALLGECLSKRILKLLPMKSTKGRKVWSVKEEETAISLHLEQVQRLLSEISVMKVEEKESTIFEFESCSRFEELLERISIDLGTGKVPAEVDRKLIEICPCEICGYRRDALAKEKGRFKLVWTQRKAAIKRLEYNEEEEVESKFPTKSEEIICNETKIKFDEDQESVVSEYNFAMELDEICNFNEDIDLNVLDLLFEDVPKQEFYPEVDLLEPIHVPDVHPVTTNLVKKRKSESEFDIPVVAKRQLTGMEQISSLIRDMEKLNTHAFSMGKHILKGILGYLSSTQLSKMCGKMMEYGVNVFSKKALKTLEDDQIQSDPRLSKSFLCPDATEIEFSQLDPIGEFRMDFISMEILEADEQSKQIVNGDLNKRSWLHLVPGKLECLLRLHHLLPKLVTNKFALSFARLRKFDGRLAVFLCSYAVGKEGLQNCKVRFQDVSKKFTHILHLPELL